MSDEIKVLTREELRGIKRKIVQCDIPDLGRIFLQKMSYRQMTSLPEDPAEQLALMLVNEDGERQYISPEEIDVLRDLDYEAFGAIIKEAGKVNNISQAAIDDALKNSKASPNGDSATA